MVIVNPLSFFFFSPVKGFFFNLPIFWFLWVSVATCELSLVAGATLIGVQGFLIAWLFLLQSTGSARVSVVAALGF